MRPPAFIPCFALRRVHWPSSDRFSATATSFPPEPCRDRLRRRLVEVGEGERRERDRLLLLFIGMAVPDQEFQLQILAAGQLGQRRMQRAHALRVVPHLHDHDVPPAPGVTQDQLLMAAGQAARDVLRAFGAAGAAATDAHQGGHQARAGQHRDHRLRRGGTGVGGGRQQRGDQRVQPLPLAQRRQGADPISAGAGGRSPPLPGELAGHHLVQQHAEAEQIGAGIYASTREQLGRHVLGRPPEQARPGEAREGLHAR